MKVLFLDDDEIRIQAAMQLYGQNTLWIVRTVDEAIDALKQEIFDFVHLDHDLGGEIHVSSDRKDCGMEVVRWIIENKPDIDRITVHTRKHKRWFGNASQAQ